MPKGSSTGERNDVALAGLNHKLGWRGTTNTLLNFGEGKYPGCSGDGARRHRLPGGQAARRPQVHVPHDERGRALALAWRPPCWAWPATTPAWTYAKNRPQGRPMTEGGKDASSPQVAIIEHADVKRMLLAQKAYCEGALALNLYCAQLVDEGRTRARRRRPHEPSCCWRC